jgi:hypothetical protein
MNFRSLLLVIFVIFTISFFSSSPLFANLETDISIDATPINPNPNENVTIKLTSFALNLDSAAIRWTVNGKNILSGTGKKSISTNVGSAGSSTMVSATITVPEGTVEKKIVLRPNTLTLLWQATDSYVPPFYKGKALPTSGSEIKVVAMPEVRIAGNMVNPSNLTYAWRKDYSNDQEGSGYGKNSFIYSNDYLDDTNSISVTVSTIDQNYNADESITVSSVTPQIYFYRKDPVIGVIWDKAILNNHTISGEEVLLAAPYFISPKIIWNPRLIWNWFINDNLVNNADVPSNTLPIKATQGTSGTSKIRLEIDNKDKLYQNVSKEINIQF